MTTFITLPRYGSYFYQDPVDLFTDLPTDDPEGTVRLVMSTGNLYWFDGATWNLIGAVVAAVTDTDSIDLTVSGGTLSADLRLSSNTADAGYILAENAIQSGPSKGLRTQVSNSLIRGLFSGTNLISYNSSTGVIDLTSATVRALFSGTNLISYNSTTGVIDLTSATIRGLFSGTAPVVYNSGTGAISMPAATSLVDGYLTSADWSTFNSKEPAISAGTTSQYWRGDKTFQTLNIAALQAITDGSSASSGQINEILSASQASNTSTGVGSTGAYGNVTSVSLTAGRWILQGVAGFHENGAVLTTALQCGISASATGSGISEFDTTLAPFLISSTSDALLTTPLVGPVSVSSPTTYYLNTRFYYTSGTPQHRGQIKAIRIG